VPKPKFIDASLIIAEMNNPEAELQEILLVKLKKSDSGKNPNRHFF
jgi:hypothetical protein